MATIKSLPVNSPEASHRIVGTSDIFGNGILAYCTRENVHSLLTQAEEQDPEAILRVEPHNPELMGKALRSTDVEWIVNSDGELGVKIGDQFFFPHKGESFMYGEGVDSPQQYRHIGKREFGETIKSPDPEFREVGTWQPMDCRYPNQEIAYHNS